MHLAPSQRDKIVCIQMGASLRIQVRMEAGGVARLKQVCMIRTERQTSLHECVKTLFYAIYMHVL